VSIHHRKLYCWFISVAVDIAAGTVAVDVAVAVENVVVIMNVVVAVVVAVAAVDARRERVVSVEEGSPPGRRRRADDFSRL